MKKITKERVQKVLDIIDKGLVSGASNPIPGKLCVEAAVCLAFDEPHGDHPSCVDMDLSGIKINLNDHDEWDSLKHPEKARAKALKRLAILQLGTKNRFNKKVFAEKMLLLSAKYLTKYYVAEEPVLRKVIAELKTARTVSGVKRTWDKISNDIEMYGDFDDYQFEHAVDYFQVGQYDSSSNRSYQSICCYIDSPQKLRKLCKDIENILIEMKVPGVQWLPLTEK